MQVKTNGNVVVNNIKVGDIHYEYDYGYETKVEVITEPVRGDDGYWVWKSKDLMTDKIVCYGVSEEHPHYSSKLYDYQAYINPKIICQQKNKIIPRIQAKIFSKSLSRRAR